MLWSMRPTTWFWSPPVLATVVKLLVNAVVLLGAGHRLRSFAEVGLIRFAGMMLPASAVGVAVLPTTPRSEEHTSELQSPCNLVCRLLLEKKKKIYSTYTD